MLVLLLTTPLLAQEPGTGQGQPTGSSTAENPSEDKDYSVRLRKMEEDIVGLKERVYNTKTRLVLLKERILADVVSGAYAVILHKNTMGSAFTLEQVQYHVDGKSKLFLRNKDGNLDSREEFTVYSGAISPGNHVITVEMIYRGSGKVFTYLKGYKFKITSRHVFYATEGRISKIECLGYERGDFTYSLEERPAIQFKVAQYQFSPENLAKLTGKKKAGEE